MKSKPNAVLLLAALLIAAVAGAVGWIGRGLFTGRASSQSAAAPPTAETSRTGSSSATPLSSPRPGAVSAEEPKAIAARLLQALLDGTQEEGSYELLKFRFREALAGCDEAVVAEMLEIFMRYAKDPKHRDLNTLGLSWDLSSLLITQMTALNPRKALDYQVGLAQAQVRGGPDGFSLIMELLAEQDPTKAQNVIDGLPPGDIRTSAEMAWWKVRIKTDPEGVFQSLMNLDNDARDCVSTYPVPLRELLWELARQAPAKALQATALFPEAPFSSLQSQLVSDWINRDPQAAVQWAMEQNDARSFKLCREALTPEKGALDEKFLRDNFSTINSKEPDDRVSLASELAERLAEQDIPEGVRWASTLPADARDEANLVVAKAWIKQDAPAAAEWLTTWPAGRAKDKAAEALTNAIVKDDPESALTWAASIQYRSRYSLMQKALDTLIEKDPAAAERAKQTLSEEDLAVLSVIKRKGFGE